MESKSIIKLKFVRPRTPLTQAGAVNGSRARALTARTPNLRRSPSRLLNFSRRKRRNHAKLEIIHFGVIIGVHNLFVLAIKSRQIAVFKF